MPFASLPEIASMVFEFQFGLYEDVRPAFRACHELLEFDAEQHVYVCDPAFRQAFAPNAEWPDDHLGHIVPTKYALRSNQLDPRLPLHLAVAGGFAQLTKRILGCRPDLASDNAIALAFQSNQLAIAELLLNTRENVPERDQCRVTQSATYGPMWHAKYMDHWGEMLAREDSKGLLLLQRYGPHPDDVTQVSRWRAIHRATLENLTLALDLFPWFVYRGLLDDVAGRGFLPLVRSLHKRGVACSTGAMDKAAMCGHLEVVRFLHLHRHEGCTVHAMDAAATNGHFDVVQFLHFNRTEGCTVDALDWAVTNGRLDMIRFLLEHRTEGASSNILEEAAVNGRLEVVQYLHDLGSFDCTVAAVDLAARNGHLDVVQFLLTNRSEGCTRDMVVRHALEGGHPRMAEYLLSLGYPLSPGEIALDFTCFGNPKSVGVFELLVAHGRPIEKYMLLDACSAGNLPLVRFLLMHADSTWRAEALESAISVNAWDIVRLFLANDATEVSASAFTEVLRAGNLAMAAQMLLHQPTLRKRSLDEGDYRDLDSESIRFVVAEGVGKPRECLLAIAGCRQHVTASKFSLPYCMDATNHLDNITFLLDLLALPDRRRKTILALITQELIDQGRKASQTIHLPPSVAARASTLLEAGDVVDWALALVICHLHATSNTTTTIKQLEKKTALVQDVELQTQLLGLFQEKP